MKLLAWIGAGALAATSLIAAAPASAQYRGHGGYHRSYNHGGGYRHGYYGRGYRRGYYGGGYRRGYDGYRCHRGDRDARRCYR